MVVGARPSKGEPLHLALVTAVGRLCCKSWGSAGGPIGPYPSTWPSPCSREVLVLELGQVQGGPIGAMPCTWLGLLY